MFFFKANKKQDNATNVSRTDTVTDQNTDTLENNTEKKANVYNLIIADESGSMHHLRQATLSGIHETIDTIRNAQHEFSASQNHLLTLVTFSSGVCRPNVRTMLNRMPIDKVEDFTKYEPNGCTPLYDAMGMSLQELDYAVKNDPTASVVVTVMTDGLENSSHEWTAITLRRFIEQLKEKGWVFAYMGSAHDVKEVTDLLAIDNVMEFSHDSNATQNTWTRENAARRSYYQKLDSVCCKSMSPNEFIACKQDIANDYFSSRVTPQDLAMHEISPNEVVVYGTDSQGRPTGRSVEQILYHFGVVGGQTEGLHENSYALPVGGSLDELEEAVTRLTMFARQLRDKKFFVTNIEEGTEFSVAQITPIFKGCMALENVFLPKEYWEEFRLTIDF